jgi:hypothetical protein
MNEFLPGSILKVSYFREVYKYGSLYVLRFSCTSVAGREETPYVEWN